MRFIRYVGAKQCVAKEYQDALSDNRDVLIDRVSPSANSTVDFRLDGKHVDPAITDVMLDIFDLGILVFLVDEMVKRSHATDYWSRTIRCLVPVIDPGKWRGSEQRLTDSLKMLSGDLWQFEWVRLKDSPIMRSRRLVLPNDCDVLCLFSGGIDSLLGAVQLLEAGRKVLLVGHQADGQTASAQTALVEMLGKLYPGKLHQVQCRVSRSPRRYPQFPLPLKLEISHRTRSFLFLTLGVAIAAKCGIEEIFMPENGLMALNIPLQKSRIGALSTRTAHPAFMLKFIEVSQKITGFLGTIRNPFLIMSKTDMLRNLSTPLYPLIKRSISCARPARFNNLKVRHCGYCVPCIHRRIALMEANLDYARDYAFDVFRNFSSLDRDKRQDFRALVQFAVRVSEATATQLQTLIFAHGYFPSGIGKTIGMSETTNHTPWTDMMKRWADDFLNKVCLNTSVSVQKSLGLTNHSRKADQ